MDLFGCFFFYYFFPVVLIVLIWSYIFAVIACLNNLVPVHFFKLLVETPSHFHHAENGSFQPLCTLFRALRQGFIIKNSVRSLIERRPSSIWFHTTAGSRLRTHKRAANVSESWMPACRRGIHTPSPHKGLEQRKNTMYGEEKEKRKLDGKGYVRSLHKN